MPKWTAKQTAQQPENPAEQPEKPASHAVRPCCPFYFPKLVPGTEYHNDRMAAAYTGGGRRQGLKLPRPEG